MKIYRTNRHGLPELVDLHDTLQVRAVRLSIMRALHRYHLEMSIQMLFLGRKGILAFVWDEDTDGIAMIECEQDTWRVTVWYTDQTLQIHDDALAREEKTV